MRIIRSYGALFLSAAALLFSLLSFYRTPSSSIESERRFAKKILANVRACIEYNHSIPQKEQIYQLLGTIEKEFEITETGNDDLRIKFVNSQGCIEHALACFQALGEIDQLIGVIHTPMPATPLCVKPDASVEGALDSSIRHDLAKLLTVRSRAQIVREYLTNGGKLYVVYPQGGLQKRTPEQQKIYAEALEQFAGRLFDWTLKTNQISEDMVGATYLFRNTDKQVFAFSIKSRQANDIQPKAEWGIWFGPVLEPVVAGRVNLVFDSLAEQGSPDLRGPEAFQETL